MENFFRSFHNSFSMIRDNYLFDIPKDRLLVFQENEHTRIISLVYEVQFMDYDGAILAKNNLESWASKLASLAAT